MPLQIPPAWKLRIFCIYLLGIMRGRPYDGGLSFLAKMQIDAEDGDLTKMWAPIGDPLVLASAGRAWVSGESRKWAGRE
ncbi:hypothetical protein ACV22V_32245 [Burkholderia sp. AW33-5]